MQGTIWNIDLFDQWRVEFGKRLAKTEASELNRPDERDSRVTAQATRLFGDTIVCWGAFLRPSLRLGREVDDVL